MSTLPKRDGLVHLFGLIRLSPHHLFESLALANSWGIRTADLTERCRRQRSCPLSSVEARFPRNWSAEILSLLGVFYFCIMSFIRHSSLHFTLEQKNAILEINFAGNKIGQSNCDVVDDDGDWKNRFRIFDLKEGSSRYYLMVIVGRLVERANERLRELREKERERKREREREILESGESFSTIGRHNCLIIVCRSISLRRRRRPLRRRRTRSGIFKNHYRNGFPITQCYTFFCRNIPMQHYKVCLPTR